MNYVAIAVLVSWAIYSWQLALGIIFVCGVIAVFYCGALTGDADRKAIMTFSWTVLILSTIMVGILSSPIIDDYTEAPKLCGRVEC